MNTVLHCRRNTVFRKKICAKASVKQLPCIVTVQTEVSWCRCLSAAVREGAAKAFMAAQTPLYNLYSHNACLEWVCSEWYRLYFLVPLHTAGASMAWSVCLHITALFFPVAFLYRTSQKLSCTLWRNSLPEWKLLTRISCHVWIPINCSILNVAKWAF